MDNQQKIIDYFFTSQNIQLTEFHQQEPSFNGVLIVNSQEKSNLICQHQIIRFDFDVDKSTDKILFAKAIFPYENGQKNGMVFNHDFIKEQMQLGQKCVAVLDQVGIKHYYPVMCFNIEMDLLTNEILVGEPYQRINIMNPGGCSYYLLEDLVTRIIKSRLLSWQLDIDSINLSDLIDMFLMADI